MTETKPPARLLGYARVSTTGQTLDAQLEQLRAAGCRHIYREKATGARADRRELLKLLKQLAAGDVVVTFRIKWRCFFGIIWRQIPTTSVLRAASTTSSVMTDSSLIFRMRSICTNSR